MDTIDNDTKMFVLISTLFQGQNIMYLHGIVYEVGTGLSVLIKCAHVLQEGSIVYKQLRQRQLLC